MEFSIQDMYARHVSEQYDELIGGVGLCRFTLKNKYTNYNDMDAMNLE